MSIKIFKGFPKFSLSECCHYSRYIICAMFSAHRITPVALYGYYTSSTRNTDTLYRKFFIPFLIKCDIFVKHTHTRARARTHTHIYIGARCSVVLKSLCYKPGGRRFETLRGEWIFSICLILPASLGPGLNSASIRNEYQKQKNNITWEQSAVGA
jgi:hypothetical protein